MVIWPEASNAQNNITAVSANSSTDYVLIRRLHSSCRRSITGVSILVFGSPGPGLLTIFVLEHNPVSLNR